MRQRQRERKRVRDRFREEEEEGKEEKKERESIMHDEYDAIHNSTLPSLSISISLSLSFSFLAAFASVRLSNCTRSALHSRDARYFNSYRSTISLFALRERASREASILPVTHICTLFDITLTCQEVAFGFDANGRIFAHCSSKKGKSRI